MVVAVGDGGQFAGGRGAGRDHGDVRRWSRQWPGGLRCVSCFCLCVFGVEEFHEDHDGSVGHAGVVAGFGDGRAPVLGGVASVYLEHGDVGGGQQRGDGCGDGVDHGVVLAEPAAGVRDDEQGQVVGHGEGGQVRSGRCRSRCPA